MNKFLFPLAVAVVMSAAALCSCSGGGGSAVSVANPGSGTVGLYVTDYSGPYTQVTATLENVRMISTGSGTSCDLLSAPVSVNIANLANVMQLIDLSQCPAGPYNRFQIGFDQGLQLLSGSTGTPIPCSFTSYMDNGMGSKSNVLDCDPVTHICSLDITGAVNVLAKRQSKTALDFDLKNFVVTGYGSPACSVTMKVSPLTPEEMRKHGMESITGIVSSLSTSAMTFSLTRGHRTFGVLYSGISNSVQPDLGGLLQRAQDDVLRTRVTASTIDLSTDSIAASSIAVKVEGIISDLTGTSFTLNYRTGNDGSNNVVQGASSGMMGQTQGSGVAQSMVIDYSGAVISGTLADGEWAEVKLMGHDILSSDFIAGKVEVENKETMNDD